MTPVAAYFDNNATAPLAPEAFEAMVPWLRDHWGNASSVHRFGTEARYAVEKSRKTIAGLLGVADPQRLTFTGGGTQAINLALRGYARRARREGLGDHLVTSAAEHHAVLDTFKALRDQEGFRLTLVPVDEWGRVRPEEIRAATTRETVLISLIYANNEVGTVNPVEIIAEKTRRLSEIALHLDAVQAVGKLVMPGLDALGADLVSITAHKFGGPKGIGLLYRREGIELEPITTGGGQEGGLFPGTENVALIVGMAAALEQAIGHLPEESERLTALREDLWSGIQTIHPSALRNSPAEGCLAGTLNVSFPGIKGQRLVAELDRRGFAVSAASACTSKEPTVSHVIAAMTSDPERQQGAIRISLGRGNSGAEVRRFLSVLEEALVASGQGAEAPGGS